MEKVAFTMHPQLLYSVIQRQAGTLSKAILEGVMNGVDARATKISIKVNETSVQIKDNGQGFRSREEIDKFFATFGQPHDASEQKVYGAFRMGRGQLFAFGTNHWRTGKFEMHVDIKNKGLDFGLIQTKKAVSGCHIDIELYTPLLPSDVVSLHRDMERMVKYVSIPVTFNGKAISRDPAQGKWDHETEDAYIKLRASGGLAIYNLGVFVHEVSGYHLGTGGEVVAKKQLKVNFARNDVQADCPVWKRVRKVVDQRAQEENVKKPRLDDAARERLAFQWMNEPASRHKMATSPIFTDTQGRHWSARKLSRYFGWGSAGVVSAAPSGDQRADKIMQQKRAVVLSTSTLERFGVETVDALLDTLQEHSPAAFRNWQVMSFAELTKELKSKHYLVPEKEYRPLEKVWTHLLEKSQYQWLYHLPEEREHRKVRLGISETAAAWTDGSTYVAFDRKFLASLDLDAVGLLRAAQVMVHEIAHDDPTTAGHLHTPEFYQFFHDAREAVTALFQYLNGAMPQELERMGKKLSRKQLKDQDRDTRRRRAVKKVVALSSQ